MPESPAWAAPDATVTDPLESESADTIAAAPLDSVALTPLDTETSPPDPAPAAVGVEFESHEILCAC